MAKKPPEKGPISPWLVGVRGVTGIVPPGRRMGPSSEKRTRKWSASGVKGVTPPGKQAPGQGPVAEWLSADRKKKRVAATKQNTRALEQKKKRGDGEREVKEGDKFDPLRPMAGFVPDAFADAGDPNDIKGFLKAVNDFMTAHRPNPESAENFQQVISQSHSPFEIVVAFTILSALIGKSTPLRRRYAIVLERGAKVFYNLATRLGGTTKPPRGLVPETVDAIFYDLPATALTLPYAFATAALLEQLELLRTPDDDEGDWTLLDFGLRMRRRFIESRSFGDKAMADLFPWELPDWAPPDLKV